MEDYVSVLTRTYLPDPAEDVVFHAKTSSNVETVRVDAVLDFLERNRGKVFITYDALGFHKACLQALHAAGMGDHSSLVWGLSQECRLWDVGLLEMRIRYAYAGFTPKIKESDGWDSFLME